MGGKRGYGVPQPKGGVNGGANGFARATGSSHYSRYFRTNTIPLMVITNGKEVLRLHSEDAHKYFYKKVVTDNEDILNAKSLLGCEVNMSEGYYYERTKGWYYTTKAIYKQYTESLNPNSKIPAPKFTITQMNSKGIEEVINTHVYIR